MIKTENLHNYDMVKIVILRQYTGYIKKNV